MTPAKISAAVDRGLFLYNSIQAMEKELKEIQNQLSIEAAHSDEQIPLIDENREGRQYLAKGSRDIVPIVLTSDRLVGSFLAGSLVHARIEAASDGKFSHFYRKVETYKTVESNGKHFRSLVAHVLGPKSPDFLYACTDRDKDGVARSSIVVEWDRAEVRA